MREAVIVEAVRSPIGKRNGSLSGTHPVDLLAHVLQAMVERSGVDPGLIEDNITGCVSQVGEQSINIGRNGWLAARFPEEIPSTTVDRQCGSSQQAAHFAAQGVIAGAYDLVVASGVENKTRVPMGSSMAGAMPYSPALFNRYEGKLVPQGISAELIATKWDLSREQLDDFSARSHARAAGATKEGRFQREIAPIKVSGEDGEKLLDVDEGIRFELDREKMGTLQPSFFNPGLEDQFPGQLNWRITAANSSQISDGAAAVLIASREKAEELGLKPRARFVSFGLAGVDPRLMLHGNPQASERALARAGLGWDDMAVIEVNEAFASVALQFLRDAGLEERVGDVNPNGGGISLGHPLGATGARITATLLNEVERRDGRYGLATMCIGFGQAIAAVIERV